MQYHVVMQTGVARGDQKDLWVGVWGGWWGRGWVARFAITDTFPLLPSCACAERAGKSMSSSFMLYKKYSIQEFSSSVVCAACLHIFANIQYCFGMSVSFSLSVCVCFFLFIFKSKTPSAFSPVRPFPVSSPGSSGGAVVIGNVLSVRQSCIAPCPSRCSPTTPSTLHRVSFSRLPLRGVSREGAPVLSEPLDVPVFLAEDGNLVLE